MEHHQSTGADSLIGAGRHAITALMMILICVPLIVDGMNSWKSHHQQQVDRKLRIINEQLASKKELGQDGSPAGQDWVKTTSKQRSPWQRGQPEVVHY